MDAWSYTYVSVINDDYFDRVADWAHTVSGYQTTVVSRLSVGDILRIDIDQDSGSITFTNESGG